MRAYWILLEKDQRSIFLGPYTRGTVFYIWKLALKSDVRVTIIKGREVRFNGQSTCD